MAKMKQAETFDNKVEIGKVKLVRAKNNPKP